MKRSFILSKILQITHHLEQDDGQNGTEGEQDGHDDHDGAHRCVVSEAGEGSDPAAGGDTQHKV